MRSILLTWSNLGLKTQCRACHIVTPDCQIEAVSPMKKEFTGDPSRASPPCPAELWRRERQKNGQISRAVLGGVGNLIWVSKTQRHACHIVTPNCQIEAVAWKRIHGWPIQSLPSLPGRTLAAGEAEKWSNFTGGLGRSRKKSKWRFRSSLSRRSIPDTQVGRYHFGKDEKKPWKENVHAKSSSSHNTTRVKSYVFDTLSVMDSSIRRNIHKGEHLCENAYGAYTREGFSMEIIHVNWTSMEL